MSVATIEVLTLTHKFVDVFFVTLGARPGVDASDHIPSTHKQLVQILF